MSRKYIGIEEARKTLGDLVTTVEQGADIIITRNGRPAAKLTAYQEDIMWQIEFTADTPYHARHIVTEALHDGRNSPSEGGRLGYVFTGGRDAVEKIQAEVKARGLASRVSKRKS